MEAVRSINQSETNLELKDNTNSEIGIELDIYGLYNTESRIQSLETMLCYLIQQGKPINDCLTALNHLKSDSVKKVKKPQTIPQKIAESIHNGFAILGLFLFLACTARTYEANTYNSTEIPAIEREEFYQAN